MTFTALDVAYSLATPQLPWSSAYHNLTFAQSPLQDYILIISVKENDYNPFIQNSYYQESL